MIQFDYHCSAQNAFQEITWCRHMAVLQWYFLKIRGACQKLLGVIPGKTGHFGSSIHEPRTTNHDPFVSLCLINYFFEPRPLRISLFHPSPFIINSSRAPLPPAALREACRRRVPMALAARLAQARKKIGAPSLACGAHLLRKEEHSFIHHSLARFVHHYHSYFGGSKNEDLMVIRARRAESSRTRE